MFSVGKLAPRCDNLPAVSTIPAYRKALLFLSHENPSNHGFGLQISITISDVGNVGLENEVPDDPSTIYSVLPAVDAERPDDVAKLSYFPSYSRMEPEQRGKYLRWLYDVTGAIDIGYVFVYYYGLERHLVFGNFDAAFDEILLLRKHHDNGSFQSYSASALVHSCLLRRRMDKLQQLYETSDFDHFSNSNLLILHYSGLDISPQMMFLLATRMSGVNRTYVRSKPALYEKKICEVLANKFGKASFPLSHRFSLDSIESIPYPIFANISFPPEVRTPRLPNFLQHGPFQDEMAALFEEVHHAVKGASLAEKKSARRMVGGEVSNEQSLTKT